MSAALTSVAGIGFEVECAYANNNTRMLSMAVSSQNLRLQIFPHWGAGSASSPHEASSWVSFRRAMRIFYTLIPEFEMENITLVRFAGRKRVRELLGARRKSVVLARGIEEIQSIASPRRNFPLVLGGSSAAQFERNRFQCEKSVNRFRTIC